MPWRNSLLEENMSAAYVKLSEEDWKELNGILEEVQIQGARYNDAMLAMTNK